MLVLLSILIISVGFVSAADANTTVNDSLSNNNMDIDNVEKSNTDVDSDSYNPTEIVGVSSNASNDNGNCIDDGDLISSNKDSNVVCDGETAKSFNELNNIIKDNISDTIILDSNFTFNPTTDNPFIKGIPINRSNIIIDGNFNTIDGNGQASIFTITGENVIIKNLYFKNGKGLDGGAIKMNGPNCTVINSIFIENNATNDGGAMYILGNNCRVINSTFTKNIAKNDGGAMYILADNCSVINSTFTGNNANYIGGAISIKDTNTNVINSTFTKNNATYGGAIQNFCDNCTIINSTFAENNAAAKGGAIRINSTNINVINSKFIGNNATNVGGAISLNGTKTNVINSTFTKNYAYSAGAFFVEGYGVIFDNVTFLNNTAESGAGIYSKAQNFNISNSTFKGNKAEDGTNHIALWPGTSATVDDYTQEHTEGALIVKFTNTRAVTFNITYGENGIIAATVFTNESLVDKGTVSVEINGRNYTANIVNGLTIIALKDLSAGEYTDVIVKYIPNDKYARSYAYVNFTVNPKSTNITAPTANFIINYNGKYNVVINPKFAGANITFILDGVKIGSAITDANGIASITLKAGQFKKIGAGTKILEARFAGNENFLLLFQKLR
ncbi:right-handed parallel beta-helix repeat-containing protein [uncultured Methanobrevibacter sp.]|uniref:right-handed parallel beta-helix repeat-containing protein n=1 Tax=uncultured Methanobrevibacter sp. TaxID=253161 RepID=UPI0025EF5350|nr:right-handed parallel beta-helix repeat-containing protein [uncultured Methanobrevibacter sp.]